MHIPSLATSQSHVQNSSLRMHHATFSRFFLSSKSSVAAVSATRQTMNQSHAGISLTVSACPSCPCWYISHRWCMCFRFPKPSWCPRSRPRWCPSRSSSPRISPSRSLSRYACMCMSKCTHQRHDFVSTCLRVHAFSIFQVCAPSLLFEHVHVGIHDAHTHAYAVLPKGYAHTT